MAQDEKKIDFPKMPEKHWWGLREKFRKSVPNTVTRKYIASALGMTETSAKANIIPALRRTGLIDDAGKPTALATRWRDDKQYSSVCKEILKKCYPQELLDLAPDASADRSAVESWIAMTTGAGANQVNKLTSFFYLLLNADPEKAKKPVGQTKAQTKKAVTKQKTTNQATKTLDAKEPAGGAKAEGGPAPSINLNVQIHVSPDATPEQIDQVFKSIAKHLKDFAS